MNLIVNADQNWGIGHHERLLVHLGADMQRFRALTVGRVIILGRRTLATFPGGRPLPDRVNIVLTRDRTFTAEPALICYSLGELADRLADWPAESVFVAGGATVYRQLLPFCRHAYVTRVARDLGADSFLPDLDHAPGWRLIEQGPLQSGISKTGDPSDPIPFRFCVYEQTEPDHLLAYPERPGLVL
jgi:dihydrofolate reductase